MAKKGIKVDPGLIESFEREKMDGAGGSQSQAPDLDGLTPDEKRTRALQGIEKCLKWTIDTVQKQADKADLPGIGNEEFREDYKEIAMINIESMEAEKLIEHSPGYMFGALTVGILVQNGMALRKKKKEDNE